MQTTQQSLFADPKWVELREMLERNSQEWERHRKEMEELNKEWDRRFKETERIVQETTKRVSETTAVVQETSRKVSETTASVEKTEKMVNRVCGDYDNKWGKLVEAITRPAVLTLFKDAGIKISQIYEGPRTGRWEEHDLEVDVILCDGEEVVAVEVKSTCTVEDVNHFKEQMQYFKNIFKLFAPLKVYPAIAALEFKGHSDKHAEKSGMFVISPSGEGMYALRKPQTLLEF